MTLDVYLQQVDVSGIPPLVIQSHRLHCDAISSDSPAALGERFIVRRDCTGEAGHFVSHEHRGTCVIANRDLADGDVIESGPRQCRANQKVVRRVGLKHPNARIWAKALYKPTVVAEV